MIDSLEIIRFFTSFRMTITAFLPIMTQSYWGEGEAEGSEDDRFFDSLHDFLRVIDQLKNIQIRS
jgi:hypothetical protein